MNSLHRKHVVLAVALSFASAAPALAQSVGAFAITKSQTFLQTSASVPVNHVLPSVPGGAYSFDAVVAGQNLNLYSGGPKLTLPNSTQYALTNGDPGYNDLYLLTNYATPKDFTSKAALDAAFPNGTYGFVFGSTKVSLQLGGADAYPADPPRVTNGTWDSQGNLLVPVNTATTLNFNSFAAYSSNGSITFDLYSISGGTITGEVIGGQSINLSGVSSDPALTSFTIPAGTLAPNQTYYAELSYGRVVGTNTTNPLGAYGFAAFGHVTGFKIVSGSTNIAPSITSQPANQTVTAGGSATFAASASGSPTPSYQWQRQPSGSGSWANLADGGAYAGTTTSALTIGVATTAMNGDQFRCVATNTAGSATTTAAQLTVNPAIAPTISNLPATFTVEYGDTLSLSQASVAGTQPITYQWSKDGIPLAGATASFFSKANVTTADSGNYTLTATNIAGSATSNAVAVTVNPAVAPTITRLPATVTVNYGESWLLSAWVSGTQPITYQWTKDGVPVPNATTQEIRKDNSTPADSGVYTLTATNFLGSASFTVTVTVKPAVAPTIANLPSSLTLHPGDTLWLSASVTGTQPITCQWFKNGVALPNATNSTYNPGSASLADSGVYTLTATNYVGSTTSAAVTVTVRAKLVPGDDLNRDGKADLLWTNRQTGERRIWLMNGTAFGSAVSLGTVPTNWVVGGTGDFNGDGYPDVLWTDVTSGERLIWLMNGTNFTSSVSLGVVSTDWRVAGVADFNGDEQPDILWKNAVTGEVSLWLMNGTSYGSSVTLGVPPSNLVISGVADFDGDGHPDILWTNTATGERLFWCMAGTVHTMTITLGIIPANLQISAAGDFNGNGCADLLMTNTTTHERSIWVLSGSFNTGTFSLGTIPAEWVVGGSDANPIQPVKLDFNADGQADLVWANTTTGEHYVWLLNGTAFSRSAYLGAVPTAWRCAATGDFNGDGKPDIVWENLSTGERCAWLMDGTAFGSVVSLGVAPSQWHIAATGDFNGDGQPDIVWENTVTGERCVWLMNGTSFSTGISLGVVPTDWRIADTGDFNGDDHPDIVWENTVTGERCVWLMNGTALSAVMPLGVVPTDWQIAAAADLNGDGQPDLIWQNIVTGERCVWLLNGTTFQSATSLGVIPVEWSIRG